MIKEIEAEDWNREVMAPEEKPVIVKFSGSHCVWCKRLEPIYEKLSMEYKEAKLLNIVIDKSDSNMSLALKYGIDSTPTLKIFYKGSNIGELVGYAELEFLKAEIEHIIRRKETITGRSTRSPSIQAAPEETGGEQGPKQEGKKDDGAAPLNIGDFTGSGTGASGGGEDHDLDIEDIEEQ